MRPTRRSSVGLLGTAPPPVPHSGEFKPKKAELRILDVFRPTCGVFSAPGRRLGRPRYCPGHHHTAAAVELAVL